MSFPVSISLSSGDTAELHSRRDYIPANADKSLSGRNLFLVNTPDYKTAVNELFRDSVDAANAKQTRADRMKGYDYWGELMESAAKNKSKKNNSAKPVYTYVLQMGSFETLGVTDDDFDPDYWAVLKAEDEAAASAYVQEHLNRSPQREDAKRCLVDFVRTLPELYPDFHFLEIAVHDDEPAGTCHVDLTFVPVGTGYKNGMPTRASMKQALKQMGFATAKGEGLGVEQWQNDLKGKLEEHMLGYGFERKYMDNHERRKSIGEFKYEKRLERAEERAREASERANEAYHTAEVMEQDVELLRKDHEDLTGKVAKAKDDELKAREEAERLRAENAALIERMRRTQAELDAARRAAADANEAAARVREEADAYKAEAKTTSERSSKAYERWSRDFQAWQDKHEAQRQATESTVELAYKVLGIARELVGLVAGFAKEKGLRIPGAIGDKLKELLGVESEFKDVDEVRRHRAEELEKQANEIRREKGGGGYGFV